MRTRDVNPTGDRPAVTVARVTNTPGLGPIRNLRDPAKRATRAAVLLERLSVQHQAKVDAVIEVRDQACRELLASGKSAAEVGRLIGRTRALVAKRFPTEANTG